MAGPFPVPFGSLRYSQDTAYGPGAAPHVAQDWPAWPGSSHVRGRKERVSTGEALPWLSCSKLVAQICPRLLHDFKEVMLTSSENPRST